MKIYKTLTRQKGKSLCPLSPEGEDLRLRPTVSNYIHIGNARLICVFDTLRRYLEYRGMEVHLCAELYRTSTTS